MFPDFNVTVANAGQAEVFFDIIFEDEHGQRTRVNHVRAIHYVPAENHPRQNTEIRFTLRNRIISNTFDAGDILEFRRTNNEDVWFNVRLIKEGTEEHNNLTENNRRFDIIS